MKREDGKSLINCLKNEKENIMIVYIQIIISFDFNFGIIKQLK